MSNRAERRALRSQLASQAKEWPEALVEVPESTWPAARPGHERPVQLWRSRGFLVQVYPVESFGDPSALRLSVNRVTLKLDGHWSEDITWEELQRLKREAGYGGWYAVEVYPREKDVVRDCNMRHLWLCSEPLPIGWFK
jgi:hypothetical protein